MGVGCRLERTIQPEHPSAAGPQTSGLSESPKSGANSIGDLDLLSFGDAREDRERDHLVCSFLADGERPTRMTEAVECALQVNWDWVVDARADPGVVEMIQEFVPCRHSNSVDVPNALVASHDRRQPHLLKVREQFAIALRSVAP